MTIEIRDVTPRDGLQSEREVSTAARAQLVTALADAGIGHVEVGSFVSPQAVPSMAGAAEVIEQIGSRDDVQWWALVPNRRGVDLARDAGIDALTLTISASDAYSQKNVHRSTAEAIAALDDIVIAASGAELDAVISCAFGSPFEDVTVASVVDVVGRVRDAGVGRITLADTTGAATPSRVSRVLSAVGADVGLHLHDTRGTALANALAGMAAGVTRFDTAVGGLGGSPFAPGAGGNLATEDLVLVLEADGVDTGIDLDALLAIAATLPDLVGHALPGRTAAAGPLPHFE